MIDIENAQKQFDKYVEQFNPKDAKIKLKIEHIKRVADISRKIAENLHLDKEHIRLAEVIGLFHDIGRFKQVEIYNTFRDKDSVNHAEFSIKILYEDNLIEKFNIDSKYDYIIKKAVLNHNKNKIGDGLNEEELLYSKIIRDADKLDIFYIICDEEYDFDSIFWYNDFNCEKISDVVMEQFSQAHVVNYNDVKTSADQIATFYAYTYNLYFDFSLKNLKEQKYLDKFSDRVKEEFYGQEVKKQIDILNKDINDYLNKY